MSRALTQCIILLLDCQGEIIEKAELRFTEVSKESSCQVMDERSLDEVEHQGWVIFFLEQRREDNLCNHASRRRADKKETKTGCLKLLLQ